MNKRLIIALDFDNTRSTLDFLEHVDPDKCMVKVGLELFISEGWKILDLISGKGFEIFLDLKLHDIPNTVYEAVKSAADHGVWMTNVHASGGEEMLTASKKALDDFESPPILIGVTVLTSLSQDSLKAIGFNNLEDQVLRLAGLVKNSGLDGVVCAPTDINSIKTKFGNSFLSVTPGVRPEDADSNDQYRISTPSEAIKKGADYIVIGRPITQAKNPQEALEKIHKEIS